MKCPHCDYEGEMRADYYEAVWQSIEGTPAEYDYTGVTDTYDDCSTQDECIRCPQCHTEIEVFGRFIFVPIEKLEAVASFLKESST